MPFANTETSNAPSGKPRRSRSCAEHSAREGKRYRIGVDGDDLSLPTTIGPERLKDFLDRIAVPAADVENGIARPNADLLHEPPIDLLCDCELGERIVGESLFFSCHYSNLFQLFRDK